MYLDLICDRVLILQPLHYPAIFNSGIDNLTNVIRSDFLVKYPLRIYDHYRTAFAKPMASCYYKIDPVC